ncbi:MAG: AraC family transcriptional regulator [Parabacteroides sp.]|nr:AraC family transcriptional regulator [Parabacteroides sp.]MBQ8530696.1 AraC family transcriptional regulator [Parabacteroides sp.]
MSRNGNGDAWKHRQSWVPSPGQPPRKRLPRELKGEPQFSMEELYLSPFKLRRKYSEDGDISYEPIERNTAPTGFRIFDDYLLYLSEGHSDIHVFAERYGLRRDDIDSLIFVFTGMRGIDFRMAFQVRMADELLRYTNLELADVSRRAGFGSANNLYLTCKREFGVAPGVRRRELRKRGDIGRFKL